MIYQQGKHNDQHSDDDESCHGYFTVQYSQTATLNKSRIATGSIRIGRSIIVAQIPGSIPQSLSGPTSPAPVCQVSFLIRYMQKGTASDHSDDSIFAQSRW